MSPFDLLGLSGRRRESCPDDALFSPAKDAAGFGCARLILMEDRRMTAFAAARSVLIAFAGFFIGLLVAAIVVPVVARSAVPAAAPASRTISIIVFGDDPCPTGTGDEIVVCARQPESERYRIPKRFRGQKAAQSPAGNSWANKVRGTEDASRTAAGIPDTCSAVGSGGQSGCYARFLAQAAAERRQVRQDQADIPSSAP